MGDWKGKAKRKPDEDDDDYEQSSARRSRPRRGGYYGGPFGRAPGGLTIRENRDPSPPRSAPETVDLLRGFQRREQQRNDYYAAGSSDSAPVDVDLQLGSRTGEQQRDAHAPGSSGSAPVAAGQLRGRRMGGRQRNDDAAPGSSSAQVTIAYLPQGFRTGGQQRNAYAPAGTSGSAPGAADQPRGRRMEQQQQQRSAQTVVQCPHCRSYHGRNSPCWLCKRLRQPRGPRAGSDVGAHLSAGQGRGGGEAAAAAAAAPGPSAVHGWRPGLLGPHPVPQAKVHQAPAPGPTSRRPALPQSIPAVPVPAARRCPFCRLREGRTVNRPWKHVCLCDFCESIAADLVAVCPVCDPSRAFQRAMLAPHLPPLPQLYLPLPPPPPVGAGALQPQHLVTVAVAPPGQYQPGAFQNSHRGGLQRPPKPQPQPVDGPCPACLVNPGVMVQLPRPHLCICGRCRSVFRVMCQVCG